MSDKKMEISEADLKGLKLKETQTKAQQAEMKLVFKCDDCNKTVDWPACCGEPMELEGDKLVCIDKECGKTVPVPECHDKACKPFIIKAA